MTVERKSEKRKRNGYLVIVGTNDRHQQPKVMNWRK